ncbi:MAG: FKBP-type peptidyl-prolyl cis-trans isomerase [Prevotella sp.]|nr:FKBP-type peptidyl-prolyl cis-trans isomerase [Prevotella sp.]
MKKLTFVAAMAIAAAMFTSCGNGTPKANLKSDVDSMSYAIGLTQTQGLKEYLVDRLQIDTAYMNDFIKGLNDGANAGDDKKKAAYYAGIQIGQQISTQMMPGINREVFGNDSTKTISLKNFMAGFIAGTTGKNQMMDMDKAQLVSESLMRKVKAETALQEFGANKEAGEKFLAENGKKEDVKTLEVEYDQLDGTKGKSFIQYKVIKEGSGPMPKDTSMVKVHYEGKTIDGKVFDSSYDKEPADMRVNQVIKGFTQALVHMPEGSIWEVYIPQELAYGERQAGQIQPFSALIFKVELLNVK